MDKRVHWHVLGAGAMGCLWAADLARAGHEVTLLLKPDHPAGTGSVMVEDGQSVQSSIIRTAHTSTQPIQHLLVCTKATDTVTAVTMHHASLTEDACVVLLQNGMGQHQQLAERFPGIRLYAALSTDGAWLKAPFHVVHAGHGLTRIGGYTRNATATALLPALHALALPIEWTDDIMPALWLKLAINCAINGLTALHDCLNGELLDDGPRQRTMQQLCEEVAAVMQATGIAVTTGDHLYQAAVETAQKTAGNRSSTLQDFRAGRATEIPALNGYIVSAGERLGIATPANRDIVDRIMQRRPLPPSTA